MDVQATLVSALAAEKEEAARRLDAAVLAERERAEAPLRKRKDGTNLEKWKIR